jgi:hypothetical protein
MKKMSNEEIIDNLNACCGFCSLNACLLVEDSLKLKQHELKIPQKTKQNK